MRLHMNENYELQTFTNQILFIIYLITSVKSLTVLSSISTTFLSMKKCNRVVSQSMLPETVNRNSAQSWEYTKGIEISAS